MINVGQNLSDANFCSNGGKLPSWIRVLPSWKIHVFKQIELWIGKKKSKTSENIS